MDNIENLALWRFVWHTRAGMVESYFTASDMDIENAIGKELSFGEILGKHSEVSGRFDREDITEISRDTEFIEKFIELIGSSGYNPLESVICHSCGDSTAYCECEEEE